MILVDKSPQRSKKMNFSPSKFLFFYVYFGSKVKFIVRTSGKNLTQDSRVV